MDLELKFHLLRTQEFNRWFNLQDLAVQDLILARLHRLSVEGHFGQIHYFDELIELKWKSGLRVYTARVEKFMIIILAGGNKNGQSKDIKKAKKILKEIKNAYARRS